MPPRTTKKTKSGTKIDGVFAVGDQVHIASSDRIYTVVNVSNSGCDILMNRNDGRRDGALCNVSDVRHVGHAWVPKERKVPPKPAVPAPVAKVPVQPIAVEKPATPTAVVPHSNPIINKLRSRLSASNTQASEGPHIVVIARAGCGKTTAIVQGVISAIYGQPIRFLPSDQQRLIWDELAKSKGAASVCVCAFNVPIAKELKAQVPEGCDAMTLHGLGFRIVKNAYSLVPGKEVNKYRVNETVARLLGMDVKDLRNTQPILLSAVEELVGLCKVNLAGTTVDNGKYNLWPADSEDWVDVLDHLAHYYQVELETDDGVSIREEAYCLVPLVLQESLHNVNADRCVDFNDMVWLPVVGNLPASKYRVLLVDEAQDLNRVQQALAKKLGLRLVFIGDPKQAIYAFAGADSRSMYRLQEELAATPAGVVTLYLTKTRRCPKLVVESVKHIVPDFEALDTAPEGSVEEAMFSLDEDRNPIDFDKCYLSQLKDGDMVLCRTNGPLVGECIRLLRHGVPAYIAGQDVGKKLISLIKKMKADQLDELTEKLHDWLEKQVKIEQARKHPDEALIINLHNQVDTIMAFVTESNGTTADVINRIQRLMKDKVCPRCNKSYDVNMELCVPCNTFLVKPKGVRFSSIHKAKGLEANNVFILQLKGARCPHPMAKTDDAVEQEQHLLYVAQTRAKERLVFVSERVSCKPAAERGGWY